MPVHGVSHALRELPCAQIADGKLQASEKLESEYDARVAAEVGEKEQALALRQADLDLEVAGKVSWLLLSDYALLQPPSSQHCCSQH